MEESVEKFSGCPSNGGVHEEVELKKLTNQKTTIGITALARHQSLIERQMVNIIKNIIKEERTSSS